MAIMLSWGMLNKHNDVTNVMDAHLLYRNGCAVQVKPVALEVFIATKDITALQVCLCVFEMHNKGVQPGRRFQTVVELLATKTGASIKECQAAINREINKGKVESGIHFSMGWLTDEGITLIKFKE